MFQYQRSRPYAERSLCFFDIEGTGVKPGYHEVIEIGFIHSEKGSLCIQILPAHLGRAQPEALKVSRYNSADWAEAISFTAAAPTIAEFCGGSTVIGHNICRYDIPMLVGNFEMVGLSHDNLFRDAIDTMILARTFLVPLGLKSLSLKACMEYMSESYDGAHNAYNDAGFAKKLYEFIVGNLKWHGKQNGKQIQESIF